MREDEEENLHTIDNKVPALLHYPLTKSFNKPKAKFHRQSDSNNALLIVSNYSELQNLIVLIHDR